ncbi:MAG: hypothetical protein ACYSSO_12975 [Planctomycetota bacterium]|jgi:hypothetical protein
MEDSKKKPIMIGVIIVCLVLAGVITFATRSGSSGGVEDLKRGVMYWVKCTAEDCEHEWEMDRKDYFQYLKEHQDPMSMSAPGVECDMMATACCFDMCDSPSSIKGIVTGERSSPTLQ